jgi:hypothetical protein
MLTLAPCDPPTRRYRNVYYHKRKSRKDGGIEPAS